MIYLHYRITSNYSVATTQPAVSWLTKPRLFLDSTGPTAPYLLELRLRLGCDFQSTQVDFFCLFFSFQNYILQHIKKHKVLLFYYVNIQCASYKLVTFIWTSLRINPAHMKSALLEMTIKMLDIIHHPCHFNASLKRQMTLRLHLPLHARRSPWPNFGWVWHRGCCHMWLLMTCRSMTKGWSEPRMWLLGGGDNAATSGEWEAEGDQQKGETMYCTPTECPCNIWDEGEGSCRPIQRWCWKLEALRTEMTNNSCEGQGGCSWYHYWIAHETWMRCKHCQTAH